MRSDKVTIRGIVLYSLGRGDDTIPMSTAIQNLPTITTMITLYLPFAIAALSK